MDEKREIHGIDQAVCLLMFGLDRVFANRVKGWVRARKGFRMNVVRRVEGEVVMHIHPVGLPDGDYVACRFILDGEQWLPYKGTFPIGHSIEELRGLSFDGRHAVRENYPLEFVIEPIDDGRTLREILQRGRQHGCKFPE